jgi:hypothetical protein
MLQIPSLLQLNTGALVYAVLGAFVLGYALGWLGRPEREEHHYGDDYVTSETLDQILRLEHRKGDPL